MQIFISYPLTSRKWAERLAESLREHGFSTWMDTERLKPGDNGRQAIERATRSADAIVVLVGPRREPDDLQRQEWRAALEAGWENPSKPLIPLLLRGAELPTFVRSKFSADEAVPVIRVENPRRDWDRAVNDLIEILKNGTDWGAKSKVPSINAKDRSEQRERLSYIEGMANKLKELQ
jgi:TIR domain